ncbi:dTMP kinase [Nocardiopsis potens]|uniref:dTMP kinase n=1 Tax=Nocardiopsis potens TaxID=1246458 RepID=UPI00047623C7|nr:dTMP kinase [Nocardiopsis potens]
MSRSASLGAPGEARSVLAIKPFRRLWVSLSLSGLGDWLSLLAMVSLAVALTRDAAPAVPYLAVSGVLGLRLLPWLLLSGPAARAADRLDPRFTLVGADALRGLLYLSVPLVGRIDWLLAAHLLAEAASLFRAPAKEAAVGGLVPKKRVAQADRIALLAGYWTAPVAAALFALLAGVGTVLGALVPALDGPRADLAVYLAPLALLASAAVAWTAPVQGRPRTERPAKRPEPEQAPKRSAEDEQPTQEVRAVEVDPNELTAPIGTAETLQVPALPDPEKQKAEEEARKAEEAARKAEERARLRAERQAAAEERRQARRTGSETDPLATLRDGFRTAGAGALPRALLLGMLGSFAAGGALVGVGRILADRLGAGSAGFGVLFGALAAGAVLGVLAGPRTLRQFSRRRLFGLALGASAAALLLTGLIPNMALAAVLSLAVGAGTGVAWTIGLTLLTQEADGPTRPAIPAFAYTAGRTALLAAAAVAPLPALLIGDHTLAVQELTYDVLGSGTVLVIAALAAAVVAVVCYRRMNGEPGDVPLMTELLAAVRGVPVPGDKGAGEQERPPGTFIVLEGGEGAGKSTQVGQLSVWLRDEGFEVVTTREPGSTRLGMRLRALLLDKEHTGMSPRAEALLYAADRADHVNEVILPALRRGAIVISDRYVDSTLAYQGAGRDLPVSEIARINDWATAGLVPQLTVLLDLPAEDGLARLGGTTDRIEAESQEFHDRVRRGFLDLAERDAGRYLVVDARGAAEQVTREIQRRIRPLLPDPVPQDSEAITGMMPVIKDDEG